MDDNKNKDELIRILNDQVEQLRSPLANLRAAAENISTHPDISPVMRSAFENIILQESTLLADAFQSLADTSKEAMRSTLDHTVISCPDILKEICTKSTPDDTTFSHEGPSCNLLADRAGLLHLLDFFLTQIRENRSSSISCKITPEGSHVYFDLIWQGDPFSPAEIEIWRDETIHADKENRTVASLLIEHESDCWSSIYMEGKSRLRIPLPLAQPTAIDTATE